ncbi:MAG: hypothetical protein IJH07_02535 [Ruminococcus sp.]|nr:hypothetical protein [Ruminococcus sp.]
MLNQAFEHISGRVEEVLKPQGFSRVKIASTDDNELVALYTSENMAYSVIYYKDRQHTLLRECAMTDEGPDNQWKTLATWMFDPERDTMKEAGSIANDFCDAISAPSAVKKVKQAKKTKKSDDGNADPLFLAKRFLTLFPDMKDEIRDEQDCYYPFRGVTFARASIVPRVNKLVHEGKAAELKKLGGILSAQYVNGDADTRSIITIVILNAIPEADEAKIEEYLSDNLKKAFAYAKKWRNKTAKPEKEKKKKKTIAQRLEGMQQ